MKLKKYYNEINNEKNFVNADFIDEIFKKSKFKIEVVYDKNLVVHCQLPNGFCITESSACVDKNNFSKEIGLDICTKRIKDKIWFLYGFLYQEMKYQEEE